MEILKDRSKTAINNASERNHYLTIRQNETPKTEVVNNDEIYMLHYPIAHPIANVVTNINFTLENVTEKVEEMIQFYKDRKVPFLIWIGPSAKPSNLEEEMEKAGIIDTEYTRESGGMWMDIQDIDALQIRCDALVEKTGIKIMPIETLEHLEDAGVIMRGVFGIPKELQDMQREIMDSFVKVPHNEREYMGFIAYIDETPVSLSSAYLGAGVAGIYNVGTLKEYQKRGIGTAVILATLIDARKRGYEISIISGTEEGFIVYKKLGFIPLPCMKQYVWFPKALQRFLIGRYYKKKRKKHN